MFKKDGLLLGDWTGLLPVYYRGSGHALTVAPTGSGKGTSAIVPNLLQHPWIFLIDPGGETPQMQVLLWLLDGDNVILSAPTSFGKSFLVDAFLARKKPQVVVVICQPSR